MAPEDPHVEGTGIRCICGHRKSWHQISDRMCWRGFNEGRQCRCKKFTAQKFCPQNGFCTIHGDEEPCDNFRPTKKKPVMVKVKKSVLQAWKERAKRAESALYEIRGIVVDCNDSCTCETEDCEIHE